MNSTSTSLSVRNQSTTDFKIFIYNFGPVKGSTKIVFDKGNCPIQVSVKNVTWLSGMSVDTTQSPNVTLNNIPAYDLSRNVTITWTIKGDGYGTCTAKIYGASRWYNNLTLSISVTKSTTTETQTTGGATTTTTTTSTTTVPYNPVSNIINQLRRRR